MKKRIPLLDRLVAITLVFFYVFAGLLIVRVLSVPPGQPGQHPLSRGEWNIARSILV